MRLRLLLTSLCLLSVACGGGGDQATGGGAAAGGSNGSGGAGNGGSNHATGGSGGTTSDGGSGGGNASGGNGGSSDPCAGPKPGPDNTGVPAGVHLTPSGSIKVMDDNAVIEGLDIAGEVTVLADNVTIKNCRITSGDYYPIRYFDNHNTGLVVQDTEMIGTNGDATSAISFDHYTALRLNIHGSADGLKADSKVLIQDSWVHDLSNGEGEHNDCVQSTGGEGVTLLHNNFSGASNANVQTGDESGDATENLVIKCNWLDGGGWTLNIRGTGATAPKGTQIIDNRFGRHSGYGPWTLDDPHPTIHGNVYDDNDEPISDNP